MTDWAMVFYQVIDQTGYTFEQIADLTPGQLRILSTKGKPSIVESGSLDVASRHAKRAEREIMR